MNEPVPKRRKWRVSGLVWALLLLITWSSPAVARQATITLLHTTDLHGHIQPTRDYQGNEGVGGLLRCASAIEEVRAETPHVLLFDCGDLFQGGMESFLTDGRLMGEAMVWLGYDAWVLGNHEFDWGLDTLSRTLAVTTVPTLGANVRVRSGVPHPLPTVRPYVMREVDGLRVAIIGLTTPGIPHWSRPELIGNDLYFERSVDSLRRIMPEVRAENPDVMVLIAHQGYRHSGDTEANEINEIARHFPELDVILGGHSHQPVAQSLINGVLYAQAGYYGIWLGRVDLVFDTVSRRIVDRRSSLIEIRDQYPEHAGMAEAFAPALLKAEQAGRRVLGRAATPFKARSSVPGQSDIQQLIALSIADATKADVVVHGVLADDGVFGVGELTENDLWRVVPYENMIGVLHLTAKELKVVLEENALLYGKTYFAGVWGIRYDLYPDAPPGRRVRNLRLPDGKRPHPRKRLRVALNSFTLASGGQRFPEIRKLADTPLTRMEWPGVDTRSAVRKTISKRSPLKATEDQWVRVFRGEGL